MHSYSISAFVDFLYLILYAMSYRCQIWSNRVGHVSISNPLVDSWPKKMFWQKLTNQISKWLLHGFSFSFSLSYHDIVTLAFKMYLYYFSPSSTIPTRFQFLDILMQGSKVS